MKENKFVTYLWGTLLIIGCVYVVGSELFFGSVMSPKDIYHNLTYEPIIDPRLLESDIETIEFRGGLYHVGWEDDLDSLYYSNSSSDVRNWDTVNATR